MSEVIATEGLTMDFGGTRALESVDLAVPQGSLYSLLGPNGSGKSTLLKLASGLLKPSRGAIRVLDMNPFKEAPILARRVGVALDDHALPRWATGKRFLLFAARLKGLSYPEAEARKAGEVLGVTEYWRREIGTYSAGMYKKLVLAQALLGDSELLLLDEPTSNLDAASREALVALLAQRREDGCTVVVASHMLTEIQDSTHLAVFLNGRIHGSGDIKELATSHGATTTVIETPAPQRIVDVLLGQGLDSMLVGPNRVEIPGNWEHITRVLETLKEMEIPHTVLGERFDLYKIYHAALTEPPA
ncbi:MAG: ABC transporter ATP-binding protein [Candidatus Geothermarchaeales archaeon]